MIGSQTPRISVEPARVGTDGDSAALLMETYGVRLDPWQRTVVDAWLGYDAAGLYTTVSAGLACPRQNGKNVCYEALELFGMAVRGDRFLHTAHQVVTAKKSFRRLESIFNSRRHPELRAIVKNIRYTNGEEAIELDNGGSIEFSARSSQRARGFDDISRVIYDEAQELTDDQQAAIMATLSASSSGVRQIILGGTPPYSGVRGEVFRRARDAVLTAPAPSDAWHEWSADAPSLEVLELDDRALWAAVNPAMGRRLTEEFTAEERRKLSPLDFARERLGWWSPTASARADIAIPADLWDSCKSSAPKPEGKTAYGVKFSADGSEVVLCGAVIPSEGPARISLIERRSTGAGTRWLAEWLNERYTRAACVVIDGRNGADVLSDRLADTWKIKNSVVRPTARDMAASASLLLDNLGEKSVTWYELQPALRQSAVTAVKRPIGGGWGFGGDDPCPVEAAALALWGARTSKRDPTRRMLIG